MDNKEIITVSTSDDGKNYNIKIPCGTSVNEVMFGVAVAIKCFVRDGVIDNAKIATDMLDRYLNDTQFDEIKDKEEEKDESI